uniref:Uncharacterized protein n=1 Tax=Oryza sativa subsp. japonica TaxID=39947 RepID=Q6EUG6_ORYSJ|nr:hypothetical protein [Oryza sativa Japonica Group]
MTTARGGLLHALPCTAGPSSGGDAGSGRRRSTPIWQRGVASLAVSLKILNLK